MGQPLSSPDRGFTAHTAANTLPWTLNSKDNQVLLIIANCQWVRGSWELQNSSLRISPSSYKPGPNTLCNAKKEILWLVYRNQI